MMLELSELEAREMKQALDSALHTLLAEIAHADQRAYKAACASAMTGSSSSTAGWSCRWRANQVYA